MKSKSDATMISFALIWGCATAAALPSLYFNASDATGMGPTPSHGVCTRASADTQASWPYDVSRTHHPSCSSSAGGVNDLGTTPHACHDDPTSVRIEVTPGKAECLKASLPQCKIPMHDFASMDYDFAIEGCMGIWAAPLWMTPDKWQWGAGSGEIDSMEFCPRSEVWLNFAGGGHQINSGLSIESAQGHVTVRKDHAGIVTIASCSSAEAASNKGQCPPPRYNGCSDCLKASNTFSCWCNEGSTPPNIYGSGGCQNGGDCMWTLVSDVWNGVRGDSGYGACMTAVPGAKLAKHQPNLKSQCAVSVEKIVLRGGGPSQRLQFGPGSAPECSLFTLKA